MIKKFFATIIGITALAMTLQAQTITKSQEYSAFNTIEVGDSFNVSFKPSESGNYMAEWTIDTVLENYVAVYVKNKTLYVDLDERAMNKDKEVKALYKGRNAAKPVLNVIIKVPAFQTLKITDDAVVDAMGTNFENNDFNLEATGNAKVNNLTVNAKKGSIKMQKSAVVTMNLTANDLEIELKNNAALNLNQDSKNLKIQAEQNAVLTLTGGSNAVEIECKNASKTNLSGSATSINLIAKDRAEVDATRFPVKDLAVNMKNNSKFNGNVSSNLSLEMDGASLTFSGNPDIKIISLSKATVAHQ